MSYAIQNYVWNAVGISESSLAFLALALAKYADSEGRNVYPAVETLARLTRCSTRMVQRRLRRLEELDVIRTVGYARGGRGKARVYCFVIETLEALSDVPGDSIAPCKPRQDEPKTVTAEAQKDDSALSPHLLKESVKNSFKSAGRRKRSDRPYQTDRHSIPPEPDWRRRIRVWWSSGSRTGSWPTALWGLPPDEPGTNAPKEVVFEITGKKDWPSVARATNRKG